MGAIILALRRALAVAGLAFAVFALTACGGGGGGSGGGGDNPQSYTVTASAGTGGTVTPGTRDVSKGATTTFTVTPDAGYSIDTVTGCGGSLAGNTYTTGAITGACTVDASFSLNAPAAATLQWSPESVKRFHFTWSDVPVATEYRLMEDPDGASGYSQVATIASGVGSHDLEVFLPARVNARYVLSACNSVGCTDSTPVPVSGNLAAAVGYVKASNSAVYDDFGTAVALSGDGNTLAVGADSEDSNSTGVGGNQSDNSANTSGAVYVFTRTGGVWNQQAYVKASNTAAGDLFGYALALSSDGNTLAVGAWGEDSNATGIDNNQSNNSASFSGAVYVFTRSSGTWSQKAYVKASNAGLNDYFGYALALSGDGNTLAVGAYGESSNATIINGLETDNSANASGAVYVFTQSGGTWSQQAYVKASNTGAGDYFGSAVTLSYDGNTLAVGAYGEDSSSTGVGNSPFDNTASSSGAAYVFTRNGTTWSQQAYIKASNTDANDSFGGTVALSGDGDTLAVGADGEDSNAIGVDNIQSDNSASASGAVYLFTRSGTTWSQQAYLKASNTGGGDNFGTALALSNDGNALAVGAYFEDRDAIGICGVSSYNSVADSGAVYLFTRSGTAWSQRAYVKASNTGTSDRFGAAVSLSSDGNALAVGANGEASNATGIGGSQNDNSAMYSGAVYLY